MGKINLWLIDVLENIDLDDEKASKDALLDSISSSTSSPHGYLSTEPICRGEMFIDNYPVEDSVAWGGDTPSIIDHCNYFSGQVELKYM